MTGLKPYKYRVGLIVKRFLRTIAILLALILVSATFTFFKPIDVESIGYQYYNDKTYRVEKTNQITDLLRGELIIRRKVNEIKAQTSEPQRQIDLALSWVTQYVRPQDASPSPVISDDYYNILKRGVGYCDQTAYVFSVLSTRLGIPARMIMLRDHDGVSHHTAAEVYLDNKWQYIDPWLGVFPHRKDGTGYTRFEFAKDQSALIKYGYTPSYSAYEFAHSTIFETFPFMSLTELVQKAIAKFRNLHQTGPAGGLSNVERNKEKVSNFKMTGSQIEVLTLYDRARELHLTGNFSRAREVYSQLRENQGLPTVSDSARFFQGVTYFNEHKFGTAEKYFKRESAQHPAGIWFNSGIRFLAESLIAQGKITEAKTWLIKSNSHGAQTRLKNLNESIATENSIPFISY